MVDFRKLSESLDRSMSRKRLYEGKRRIGIDTETTGLELRHNCSVYLVTIAFEAWKGEPGKILSWEWPVDTKRQVSIPLDDAEEIRKIIQNEDYVPLFAHAKFDVLGLEKAVRLNPYQVLKRCRDVVMESHLLNSSESHALKDLALKYCSIDTSDVEHLQAVVNQARSEARSINERMKRLGMEPPFLIGSPEAFIYQKRQPDGGWWIVDTWLPKTLARWKVWMFQTNPQLAKKLVLKPVTSPATAASKYCEMDSVRTLAVDSALFPSIDDNSRLADIYFDLQRPQLEVLYRMESFGIGFDKAEGYKAIEHYKEKRDSAFKEAIRLSGDPNYNPASPTQTQYLLYEKWKQPITKWTKNENNPSPSTDVDALCGVILSTEADSRPNQFCRNLLLGKKCSTCITYLNQYMSACLEYRIGANGPVWDRLHPSFNPTGTDTTRLSSSSPNAQNIGKGKIAKPQDIANLIREILEGENISLRRVFGPMPGREWWTADYVQLQLAIFAYVTGDPDMIAAIEAGRDFHDFMTRKIFNVPDNDKPSDGQRTVGKNVDFGYIFGAGDNKIDKTSGIKGLSSTLREMFPHATEFIKSTSAQVRRNGYVMAGGYPLQVDQKKPYAGVNYIVQGYEGIIVKQAMINVHNYLMSDEGGAGQGQLTINVHDELVFDFPKGMGELHVWNIRELMKDAGKQHGMKLGVDFKYTTTNWSDTMKVEFEE